MKIYIFRFSHSGVVTPVNVNDNNHEPIPNSITDSMEWILVFFWLSVKWWWLCLCQWQNFSINSIEYVFSLNFIEISNQLGKTTIIAYLISTDDFFVSIACGNSNAISATDNSVAASSCSRWQFAYHFCRPIHFSSSFMAFLFLFFFIFFSF